MWLKLPITQCCITKHDMGNLRFFVTKLSFSTWEKQSIIICEETVFLKRKHSLTLSIKEVFVESSSSVHSFNDIECLTQTRSSKPVGAEPVLPIAFIAINQWKIPGISCQKKQSLIRWFCINSSLTRVLLLPGVWQLWSLGEGFPNKWWPVKYKII